MDFQIHSWPAEKFSSYFNLSDEEIKNKYMRLVVVEAKPGTPCRISLEDAEIGETVLLLNYEHLPEQTPFQSRHAIFVWQGAVSAKFATNEVPQVISSRLISVRYFDKDHMMVDADVVEGVDISALLRNAFDKSEIEFAHLHYAKLGCFATSATRAFMPNTN